LNDLRFDNKIRFGICPSLLLLQLQAAHGLTLTWENFLRGRSCDCPWEKFSGFFGKTVSGDCPGNLGVFCGENIRGGG